MMTPGKIGRWAGRLLRLGSGWPARAVAVAAAGATLMIGVEPAFAGGGAGSSDGGGGGAMASQVSWTYKDANDGAYGSSTDFNSIYRAFSAMGVSMQPEGVGHAQKALNEANSNCVNRFNEAHPDQYGQAQCRVTGVGVMTGPNKSFSGEVHHTKDDWINAWADTVVGKTFSNHGATYQTNYEFQDQPGTSVDSLVMQYARDSTSIIVIALNQYEPKPAEVPPAPPSKTVQPGTSADSMGNHTVIGSGTGVGGKQFVFRDTFDPKGQGYVIDHQKVVDTSTGQDISGSFNFNTPNGGTPAGNVATATWKGGDIPSNHNWQYELDVIPHNPDTSLVKDTGSVYWKGSSKEADQKTPDHEFPTWRPNPDKSWVLWDKVAGKWQAVVDPSRTNSTGADEHVFLDGDKVAGVVNGTVDPHLIDAPNSFALTDDWSAAEYLVDQDGRDRIRVYEAQAAPGADGHYRQTSVADIAAKGRDVTDQFEITVSGSRAVAKAKPAYLAKLKGMGQGLQVTMLVPFTVNFANGKGAAQARKDHNRKPGDELTFCSPDGSAPQFTNKGSEQVNGQTVATNQPKICGYVPPVKKDVVSEASQGGDQDSVDGKVVYPGQKVEYQLTTQPKLPDLLAYQGERVIITDTYDQWLNVDKQTLELMDLNTGRVIPKSRYSTKWDDGHHLVQVVFTDQALIGQWRAGGNPRIQLRFEGTVDGKAPAGHKVNNQWMLTLNNSLTPSNEVFNTPPDFNPLKKDVSSKDQSISIDGKTLLLGDTGYYRVTLDARQTNQAYAVWRLGLVDDFDDEYLSIDPSRIEVQGSDGKDYTKAFNIQVRDGVVYAFARTVDTRVPATGETLKGDPQPADLAAYAAAKGHNPLREPAIDQGLLGRTYDLVLPYKVIKVKDGYVVKNKATQIINDLRKDTNQVSNPLKPLNPSKDVVVKVNGESTNGKSVYQDRLFLYQLDSSILPANRAYAQADRWLIEDQLDPKIDQYTGQWAVYATRDLYKDGKVLAGKGERIAGSGFDSSKLGKLFTLEQDQSGKVTIQATPAYLALVSASGDREAGWRAYIQCKRLAVTKRHENRFTEYYNDKVNPSNVVWTRTPDMTPRLRIVKFDTRSGLPQGDRNDPKEALTVDGDTDITVRIYNDSGIDPDTGTGYVFLGRDLKLEDRTVAGDGQVVDWKYPDGWADYQLKPGKHVDVHGTLKGVTEHHTNRAKVTGRPLAPCVVPGDDKPFDPMDPDAKPGRETPKDAVMVDGVALCGDTTVESNTDDWNGVKPPALPVTGSQVAVALLAAGLLLLGGFVSFQGGRWMRRRHAENHEAALAFSEQVMAQAGAPEPDDPRDEQPR